MKRRAIPRRWLFVVLLLCACILLLVPPVLAAECPSGCSCLSPEDAKSQGYEACSEKQVICSYDNAQRPMYCYRKPVSLVVATRNLVALTTTTTTVPPAQCPQGCECLTDDEAAKNYGNYQHCSDTPCAKVVTGSAAFVYYCSKPVTTQYPTCPSGCECMNEPQAKEKFGTYERCSDSICAASTAATSNYPSYCFRAAVTVQPACPTGCDCLTEAQAKAKFGERAYSRCSETSCGSESMTAAVALVPKYCYQYMPPQYPACPSGCTCMNEAQAKEKYGTYERCSDSPCAASTAATANLPPYCYKPVTTTTPQPACPTGCDCLTEAQAKAKFGENGYSRCSAASCGSESMTTAAAVVTKYCFQQGGAVPPVAQCPEGCACMSDAAAKEKGYPACRGERTSCGYDANQVPLFCYEVVPSAACTFDYQKNACTGTCQQGYSCSVIAQEKDAAGAVKYGVCGCQPPAAECTYNANLQACTGTCSNGGTCVVTGKKVDASGAVSIACGCESPACLFDYATDACTGTCAAGTGICQLNTIYRDAAGKTIYGECHCKEKSGQETPVTVTETKTTVTGTKTQTPQVPATCTCSAGSCTGSCPDGQTCWMTATATDNLGKVSCTACACRETCTLTANNECTGSCPDGGPCTRVVMKDEATGAEKVGCQCGGTVGAPATTKPATAPAPDIVSAITNFFRSLFGMK